ncbi:MAG: hypothetical protein ACK53Y_11890, partial [bacterium]
SSCPSITSAPSQPDECPPPPLGLFLLPPPLLAVHQHGAGIPGAGGPGGAGVPGLAAALAAALAPVHAALAALAPLPAAVAGIQAAVAGLVDHMHRQRNHMAFG